MTVTDFNKSDKSPPPFGTSFPIDSTGVAHSVSIPQCIYPTPPPIRHLFEENKIHKKLLVDENLVQNQLFGAHKTQYLPTNVLNLSNCSSCSAEKGNVK
jgi:hypothetical protein